MLSVMTTAAWLAGIMLLTTGCDGVSSGSQGSVDYRQEMRDFVRDISAWSRSAAPGFIVIPQNGIELITMDGLVSGAVCPEYVQAVDGAGQEELLYGYNGDNLPTPSPVTGYLLGFLQLAEECGMEVMVTDYCWDAFRVDSSYLMNESWGFISFAADRRELDDIPSYPTAPWNLNQDDIASLPDARNFLYLIDPSAYTTRGEYLEALRRTDYDVILIDLFYGDSVLSQAEVSSLKQKAGGGKRLVISYVSIGQAEDYRYYWQDEWSNEPPPWLRGEDPEWFGNYFVEYWDSGWQSIIFGGEGSYIDLVLDSGFDGVYLDRIDAFEYFENDTR